jgi:hypothetical protein
MTNEKNSIDLAAGRLGPSATSDAYEPPVLSEYGSLTELTLSGSAPLSDSFGGAAGGGS